MSILALDLSLTATGWARSDGKSGVIRPKGEYASGIDRIRYLRYAVRELCGRFITSKEIDLCVIEGYAFGRIMQAHHLGELGGVIRVWLADNNIPFVEIAPKSLKLFATGKGNAPKDVVLTAAIQKLGYGGNSHDEADALWLLEMARVHYALPASSYPLDPHQVRAQAAIHWPMMAIGAQLSTPIEALAHG